MAPTLTAAYFVSSAGTNANTLTTPSFTPADGDVLIVKMTTWDTGVSMGSVTGGGQTYTSRVVMAPGGFRPWAGITTAVMSGSPGSMTVSATPSASARHSMVVERWTGAQLAVTPATGSAQGSSGAANTTVTAVAANSIVTWAAADAVSLDPATRAYLSSATEDGLDDNHLGANGVSYYAWQSAAVAGSQSCGLSAPTGMSYVIAGIEVQAAAGETGQATLVLPALTASASGTAVSAGTATIVLPALTGSVSGMASSTGACVVSLPALTASATGLVEVATSYADPELLVSDWLNGLLGIKTWADPVLPSTWRFEAPVAHVQRGRGLGAVPLSLDDVTLDIDVYAANADHARKTASDIWAAMTLRLPLTTFSNGVFCKFAGALTQPMWTPDPKVFRRTAAYRVVLHGFVS